MRHSLARRVAVGCVLLVAGAACGGTDVAPAPASGGAPSTGAEAPDAPGGDGLPAPSAAAEADLAAVTWEQREVAAGLEAPVAVVAVPGVDATLVVEQPGRVRLLDDDLSLVADLSDDVDFGGEKGLLGLAVAPDFPADARAFVHFSGAGDGRTVLLEVPVDPDRLAFDLASAVTLLEVPQPASNHNGGSVAFGPDGMLFLALGDGGAADDRFGNGQRSDTLLATLLRLDVSTPGAAVAAPGNPYLDGGGDPRVWATGLRNPYRIAFHDDWLVVADVGQNRVEEVDVVAADAAGSNFGWPVFEGDECFAGPCDDPAAFVAPVATYRHDDDGGCSIIGAAVYDGPVAVLQDHVLHGDFCSGVVHSFRITADGTAADATDWTAAIGRLSGVTSFSPVRGEVYATLADGRVLHLVPSLP